MRSPIRHLRGVFHPEAFHGHGVRGGYFEGWYIKLISADLAARWAVIPGIFRAKGERTGEAFVQVLDGLTGRSWYHRYPVDQFRADDRSFVVEVGANRFDHTGVRLDLPQLRGTVTYATPPVPYPVTPLRPGIMGWYGYVPVMECLHGIVSFGHGLAGALAVEDTPTSFTGGRGYIEKDWGRSFPAGYVWLASNHLSDDAGKPDEGSLTASCAIIPGLGRTFRGSIVALRRHGRISTWATWNGSTDTRLSITDDRVDWELRGPDGVLAMSATRPRGGLLHAPLRTAMHRRVEETLDARVTVRHTGGTGETLFAGTGVAAGLEVFGDTDRLIAL